MFIDTHAHYDDEAFDSDRHESLMKAKESGAIFIVNAAQNKETSEKCVQMAHTYDFIYCTVGIHPHNAGEYSEGIMSELYDMAMDEKVVAIGETGLDYHYDFFPPDVQIRNFIGNIGLAREVKKPVVIHDREAHEDMINILKNEKINETGGVLHCYSGSYEMAKEFSKLNLYFSIGGAVTFKNASKIIKAIEAIPNDRLMLETDCPYMTPVPYRGKRNESGYILLTAQKIAEIKGMKLEELLMVTNANATRLFVKSAQKQQV